MSRIYLSPPDMGDAEREAILRAFDSNWVTTLGPEVDAFEDDMCAFTGAPAAAAVNSGTAGLHLALIMSGVERGDEVWVSTLTFIAPANAITYVGAVPRFIDSERQTWNMDPDLLAEELARAAAAGRLPKAVIAVSLYGQAAQLDRISALCDEYGVTLIEDAAEALGATWQGRNVGTFGRFGVYSFNGNKIMTTSGGGMMIGSSEDMDRARYLGSQAKLPVAHYEHDEVGFNYRLSNILAAMGRAQLGRLPSMIDRCRQINATYWAELAGDGGRAGGGAELAGGAGGGAAGGDGGAPGSGTEGVGFMPWDDRGAPNGWLTLMTLDRSLRDRGITPMVVCQALAEHDIEARPSWKPMHQQKVFANAPLVGGAVADELFDSAVCLPSGSTLSESDQARVIEAVRSAIAR